MFSLSFRRTVLPTIAALAGAFLTFAPSATAAAMRLVDFGKLGVESQITVNGSAEVATQIVENPRGKSLEVRCTPGANAAPGVVIRPGEALDWNLSAYGEIEADVTNLSDAPLVINLRVDNSGDGHEIKANIDKVALPVGKSGTVRVYFGYTMGEKAYVLDPAKVSQVVIFTAKPAKGNATFLVTALRATGKPGDKPAGGGSNDLSAKPGADGAVVRFDGSLSASQVEGHGMKFVLPPASKPGPAVLTVEPGANRRPSVVFKMAAGTLLDLSASSEVEFALKNISPLSVHVFCRVENAPGINGKAAASSAEATLEPGESKTVTVPLTSVGEGFANDRVRAVVVAVEQDGKEKKIELAGIKATAGKSSATPAPTATATPSVSPSPTATATPSAGPTPTATPSPTASPTPAGSKETALPKTIPVPKPKSTPAPGGSPIPAAKPTVPPPPTTSPASSASPSPK